MDRRSHRFLVGTALVLIGGAALFLASNYSPFGRATPSQLATEGRDPDDIPFAKDITFSDPEDFIRQEFGADSEWSVHAAPDIEGPYRWRRKFHSATCLSGEMTFRCGIRREEGLRHFEFRSDPTMDLVVFPVNTSGGDLSLLVLQRAAEPGKEWK